MITSNAITLAHLLAPLFGALGTPEAAWTAPKLFVDGRPYAVHIEVVVPANGELPAWKLEAAAFQIDGQPLAERKNKEVLTLSPGAKLALDVDLGPAIGASKLFQKRDFKIDLQGGDGKPQEVRYLVAAETGLDFMDEKKVPTADLAQYFVLMETNRGNMLLEFWPDVAPGHVRNYLDLSYTGFYTGTLFHRVGAGFMIQGGDPLTKDATKIAQWGSGQGPHKLKHEFSAKKHVRGVLSMARGGGRTPAEDEKMWDSASSQYFIMDGPNPGLDGKYSAFGTLVDGFDTLTKIASSPGPVLPDGGTMRPAEAQKVTAITVLRTPPKK